MQHQPTFAPAPAAPPTAPRRANIFIRVLRFFWGALNAVRRLVFGLLAVFFLLALLAAEDAPILPAKAALVVAPEGLIVEQLEGDAVERAIARMLGTSVPETRLKDLIDAIDEAAGDKRIEALLLDLDGFLGAGLPKLQDLAQALGRFRDSGKTVVASADFLSRSRYHLAAQADEIYLPPLGAVVLEGFSVYRPYYKEGIERYEIDWNVFRVGDYKSAVEPYLRRDMSPEVEAGNLIWLNDLWQAYLADVGAARELAPAAVEAYAVDYVERLRAAAGDAGKVALEAGLIDHLGGRDEVRARMIELVGENDEHTFRQVDLETYLDAVVRPRREGGDGEIAVVVAAGTILPGRQPSGSIGGESTASLIRRALEDEEVEALVLRVDSGGGSVLASEVIRRELSLVREAGKPVVVSMGSVAASGGYWIAAASDEIWASPSTITGSIGIFAMFPTFQGPLEEYFGIEVDGVGTTPLAGRIRPDMALPEEAAAAIQLSLEDGYRRFVTLVADAREMSVAEVEAIAAGRVWSGEDAAELGLVDHLGGLEQAIAAAAERAGLGESYGVRYIEKELSVRERLLLDLMTRSRAVLSPVLRAVVSGASASHPLGAAAERWRRTVTEPLERLLRLEDPKGLFAHCGCEVR